jgi:hypothetical protein
MCLILVITSVKELAADNMCVKELAANNMCVKGSGGFRFQRFELNGKVAQGQAGLCQGLPHGNMPVLSLS